MRNRAVLSLARRRTRWRDDGGWIGRCHEAVAIAALTGVETTAQRCWVTPDEKLPVEKALRILLAILQRAPVVLFQRIGGDVEFIIREGDEIVRWFFTAQAGIVELKAGPPTASAVKVAIRQGALTRLVQGTLDVDLAFKERRLGIAGEPKIVERFCQCFLPPAATSAVGVRAAR